MKKRKTALPPKAAKGGKGGADLGAIFDELQAMMAVYVPPFTVGGGQIRAKRDYHLIVPVPVMVAPNAYGGKPYPVAMASLILQKGYVGFYYMPVYMDPGVKKKLAPEFARLLKGKSCFHVKALTPGVREGITSALEIGVKCFRERGWA
jgi:hypothetical protein